MHRQIRHDLQRSRPALKFDKAPLASRPRAAYEALKRLIRDCLPLLLAVAGYPSPSIGQHQQHENHHRQANTPGQRLDGTMADTAIPQKKEQPGKQAAHYTDQHENNDEL